MEVRNIIFFLVFIVGGILLQIFLSKSKSKWPGLVLPIITFIFSLLWILGIATFEQLLESTGTSIVLIITTFLLANIPTIVLLAIYFSCQRAVKNINEIDKMNIQDLE